MTSHPAVEAAKARWNTFESPEEATLLRLSCLRDLIRDLHADKSRLLAKGKKQEAQDLKTLETRIEDLRTASELGSSLDEILVGTTPIKKRTRLLPDALYGAIPKQRFDRYDRIWETALAAEAASLGWTFWAMDAWVGVQSAEEFQKGLQTNLLPHAVILFAESHEKQEAGEGQSLWHGLWYIVMQTRFRTPDFKASILPGVSQTPTPPAWKSIFLPKRR
jgi:hypothetical protein